MPRRKPKSNPAPLPIADIEEANAQRRLAKMLEKSGYQSKSLEKMAGQRKQIIQDE
jgi:hypothetical protein